MNRHSLREQIGQLVDRERVLISENDQLRAQLVEMKQQEQKKYDDLMVQYRELSANANIKREYEDNGLDRDGITVKEEIKEEEDEEDDGLDKQGTANNQVTVKTEWDGDEEVEVEIIEEFKEEEDDHDIIIKREYVPAYIKTESNDVKVEIKEEDDDDHDIIIKREYVPAYIKTESNDVKVEIKEEIKEEEDDDDHDIIIKPEYVPAYIKTESNDVKVEIKEEIKEEEDDDDHDIIIKPEYVPAYIKTESNDVKVEIKEEIKEEEDDDDHDIIIKPEYVPAYIKTESNDVKVEIKEEIKEEEDDDDHDDDRGCDLRLVKKELVSDDDDYSMPLDESVNVYEVMQPNQPKEILSRDQLNSPVHSVFELSPSANEQMQLTNSSTVEQSVDQQVDKADHELNEPDNHGRNQSTTTKQSQTRKRKSLTTEDSSHENSSTSSQVSTPGPKKISKRTRVSSLLDRTETVQEVSTAVAVDEREGDEQNGEGLGQSEYDDDETELGEDEGGRYKIEIVKLKCTEDGCGDEVADRDELHDHLRVIHHISPFRCLAVGCNERFEQWGELGNHVLHDHSNISTWPCAHCTKTFKTHHRLYQHLHWYHIEGQFKCGYDGCHDDRVATLRIEIMYHQYSVHPKPTMFTCQFPNCGKSFNHKFNFDSHQRIHSGDRPFRCDWTGCGKSFTDKSNFSRHKRAHQDVKPFKCNWNMCDYASNKAFNVISHIRTQHFHLPASQKKQRELGIEDNRNPRDYFVHEHN